MKVSVITVSFNAVSCIERTIKSVISQRYNDFEYIIVDGQSNDGTIEIIQKYHAYISKWISEPDRGIYNAMNKAVRICSGEYCIFMNAGDMFVNPLVLKQVSLFLDDGFDVLTGCEISTKNGKIVDYVKPPQKATLKHFFVTSISHQASFIKRSLLLEYPYDEHLKLVSDWKFWLQTLVLDGKSYRSIDVDVCVFNHDGMTYAFSDIGNMERKEVLMSLLPKDVYEEYVKRYSGFWFAKKRRYYGKLQRILHIEELKNKLKIAKSYVDVLGFYGFIVVILKIFKSGGPPGFWRDSGAGVSVLCELPAGGAAGHSKLLADWAGVRRFDGEFHHVVDERYLYDGHGCLLPVVPAGGAGGLGAQALEARQPPAGAVLLPLPGHLPGLCQHGGIFAAAAWLGGFAAGQADKAGLWQIDKGNAAGAGFHHLLLCGDEADPAPELCAGGRHLQYRFQSAAPVGAGGAEPHQSLHRFRCNVVSAAHWAGCP